MRSVALVVALAACLHAGAWALFETRQVAPDVNKPLASVSYDSRPGGMGTRPTITQMREDLRAVAPYTRAVRTYASTGGMEAVPTVAAELGLKVNVGIWIDERAFKKPGESKLDETDIAKAKEANEREIRSGIELARRHNNVASIVVGNETLYRDPRVVDDLIKIIQRVKKETQVPVTTGEIVSSWTDLGDDSLKLARAVDFIAAHSLPYWNGVPADQAVDAAIDSYNMLRRAYPGKRVVIAEFGWPSAGYNRQGALPGRAEQASIIRDFVTRAQAMGIDYNIIEAFDQPWKTMEGSVGQYWGLFDASRQPKFQWNGPIVQDDHWKLSIIAVAVGFLLSLPILTIVGATFGQAVLLAFAANVVGAWTATVFQYWNSHYFVPGAAFALGLGVVLLVPLVLIALARIQEIAAILFGPPPRRLLPTNIAAPAGYAPKVSIHVPAHMEPPEMLRATLDAIAGLDYPNFECVVVINNTPDPAYWRPIEDHCRELGERFKFVNVEGLAGFKAGALRLALARSAPDTEIVAVVDADYAVQPDWLRDLVPVFADPKVGLIQAPQDHRDGARSPMHRAMCAEYAGFFDIGMVLRNEANAIIVHGTMCLIRKSALEDAGGWSSDTICEDTDLGLTLLEQGWLAHYTNRRYGHGLLPDTFEAYKKQRDRWAFGGLQIAKKHCRRLLSGSFTRLSRDQRREFAMGWLNWLGAESVGVLVALLNLVWVPVVAFLGIAIPDKILTLPIIATFMLSVLHFTVLYRARVALPARQAAAAMFAAMAMQWTVARAVGFGLVKEHLPFVRTAKGGNSRRRAQFPAFYEAVLGCLLVLGAAIVFATNNEHVREIDLFADVLLIQSLPFLAAAALAALEASRINDFMFWRGLETRLLARLRPAAIAQAAIAEAEPAENRIEAAP
jgi:exo-beta-1,3-glucanase (GH17 family)/cellulose synthase/poly-beta-1,6-N-acetylglucosamine synthase-like glycosyltransferase